MRTLLALLMLLSAPAFAATLERSSGTLNVKAINLVGASAGVSAVPPKENVTFQVPPDLVRALLTSASVAAFSSPAALREHSGTSPDLVVSHHEILPGTHLAALNIRVDDTDAHVLFWTTSGAPDQAIQARLPGPVTVVPGHVAHFTSADFDLPEEQSQQ